MTDHSPWLSRSHFDIAKPRCAWRGCRADAFDDIPVCLVHGLKVSEVVDDYIPVIRQSIYKPPDYCSPPLPDRQLQPYVYYPMLGPLTVKIGTTIRLPRRVRELRSEIQYVVALEPGGTELERQRHRQFADERRHKLREDFHLSDRLKAHIDSLSDERDALMQLAT